MKDIEGLEGKYAVDEQGRVWSHRRNIFLKGEASNCGYLRVNLAGKKCSIHRLVAQAFVPTVEGKPYVNHKDGVKTNNCPSNLEWCTMSENVQHAFDTGLKFPSWGVLHGKDNPRATLTEDTVRSIVRDSVELSQRELAKKYKTSKSAVKHILSGRSWKHITGGRTPKVNKRLKLNMEKARSMRKQHMEGTSISELARQYCVGIDVVSKVIRGVTWKEVQ